MWIEIWIHLTVKRSYQRGSATLGSTDHLFGLDLKGGSRILFSDSGSGTDGAAAAADASNAEKCEGK